MVSQTNILIYLRIHPYVLGDSFPSYTLDRNQYSCWLEPSRKGQTARCAGPCACPQVVNIPEKAVGGGSDRGVSSHCVEQEQEWHKRKQGEEGTQGKRKASP